MLKTFKPFIERGLTKIFSKLPQIPPNVITVIGIVPPVLFYWFLDQGMMAWAILSYCGVLFDLFDGVYARATNRVTAYGAFLDSTLDRVADGIFLAAFGAADLVRWPLVIAVIIASYLISYSRSRGESVTKNTVAISQGPIERAERLAIVFLALVGQTAFPNANLYNYNVAEVIFITLLMLSIITIGRRMRKVYQILN